MRATREADVARACEPEVGERFAAANRRLAKLIASVAVRSADVALEESVQLVREIDADAIARLWHRFRGELIAALTDAENALASGDEVQQRAATARVTKLLGAIDAQRSGAVTEKAFMDFMRPVRGDHAVMRKFATRAGVSV